jgi:hypothetical protein
MQSFVGQGDFAGLLETPGVISPKDVLYFRGEVFRDGIVSEPEAKAIIALNGANGEKCAEWNSYYVETLTLYVVDQMEPRGYVSHANAQWLVDAISRDGRIEAANELELLLSILSRAQSSPELLVGFTLTVVAKAVLEGEGPLASGRQLQRGVIGEAEVELIRRVLYAYGGESGISISKTEAEILFDLNDRSVAAENHPAWRELFVKATANYLMAAATDRAPSRTEAIAREEWLQNDDSTVVSTLVGAFTGFGEMFSKSFLTGLLDDAHDQMERAWRERNARMEASIAQSEKIDDIEADWLIEKLNRDGIIHENEKALLAFIRRNSPQVSQRLDDFMDRNQISA